MADGEDASTFNSDDNYVHITFEIRVRTPKQHGHYKKMHVVDIPTFCGQGRFAPSAKRVGQTLECH